MMKRQLLKIVISTMILVSPFSLIAQTAPDYTPFMEKLIAYDSKGWDFYDYDHGSMQNVTVYTSSDGTYTIHGEYSYNTYNSFVDVFMRKDNTLICIKYANEDCRAPKGPSSRVAAVWAGPVIFAAIIGAAVALNSSPSGSSTTDITRNTKRAKDLANAQQIEDSYARKREASGN